MGDIFGDAHYIIKNYRVLKESWDLIGLGAENIPEYSTWRKANKMCPVVHPVSF